MPYTGVYVFGDSLVDAGNALELADWYGDLPFNDLPEGAPTADRGYYDGRFTDGLNFADLLANKAIGSVTQPVFPYGFEDPWIGVPIAPFANDPNGNNLNFAYGGAQVRQGDEVVQDLDGQTDTFRDAVDGDAPPGALYIVTMGGNDVRNLATVTGNAQPPVAGGFAALDNVAQQMTHELGQLIDDGAVNFLITGCADVGFIPDYDINNNNILDPDEQMRSDTATAYSQYLDLLIRTEVVPALRADGRHRHLRADADYQDGAATVTGGLNAILPTLEALEGLAPGTLTTNLLDHRGLVFFDDIHPTAQIHALFGAYAQAILTGTAWVETLPLTGARRRLCADRQHRRGGRGRHSGRQPGGGHDLSLRHARHELAGQCRDAGRPGAAADRGRTGRWRGPMPTAAPGSTRSSASPPRPAGTIVSSFRRPAA